VISKTTAEQLGLKQGETVSVDILKKDKLNGFGICKGAKALTAPGGSRA